jgi:hypothetical protein
MILDARPQPEAPKAVAQEILGQLFDQYNIASLSDFHTGEVIERTKGKTKIYGVAWIEDPHWPEGEMIGRGFTPDDLESGVFTINETEYTDDLPTEAIGRSYTMVSGTGKVLRQADGEKFEPVDTLSKGQADALARISMLSMIPAKIIQNFGMPDDVGSEAYGRFKVALGSDRLSGLDYGSTIGHMMYGNGLESFITKMQKHKLTTQAQRQQAA